MQQTGPEIIAAYLNNIDTALSKFNGNRCDQIAYLHIQLQGWQARERKLERWAQSNAEGPCPFPLNAFEIALVLNEIGARLAKAETAPADERRVA